MFYLGTVPSPVSNIDAITDQTNPDSVTLTWNVTGRRDKFLISYSPDEPASHIEVTDLNYTFTDLIPGTTFTFTFVTVGSDGNQSTEATKEVALCELSEFVCDFLEGLHHTCILYV